MSYNWKKIALDICNAFDTFLDSVYQTSQDFFETYDIFNGEDPESISRKLHKQLNTPLPQVPSPIENLSDEEYAKIVYDGANILYSELDNYIDEPTISQDYDIEFWMDYAKSIMNAMSAIMVN